MALPLVRSGFSEKLEKLRHRPRPGLEPTTKRKSEILYNKMQRTSGLVSSLVPALHVLRAKEDIGKYRSD